MASTLNEAVAVNLSMHLSHLWPFCELEPCMQLDVDQPHFPLPAIMTACTVKSSSSHMLVMHSGLLSACTGMLLAHPPAGSILEDPVHMSSGALFSLSSLGAHMPSSRASRRSWCSSTMFCTCSAASP